MVKLILKFKPNAPKTSAFNNKDRIYGRCIGISLTMRTNGYCILMLQFKHYFIYQIIYAQPNDGSIAQNSMCINKIDFISVYYKV